MSVPYVDGGTIGGPYFMSTNVNLTVAIIGKTIQLSFSVIREVMMTILPLQRLRVQILLDMFF
ncbi:hypothetical protein [Lysinibacillus boronitolerans]|nr:hypothetical protein [Lysinibacillus boronitolerans]